MLYDINLRIEGASVKTAYQQHKRKTVQMMFKECKLQMLSILKLGFVVVIVAIITLTRIFYFQSLHICS